MLLDFISVDMPSNSAFNATWRSKTREGDVKHSQCTSASKGKVNVYGHEQTDLTVNSFLRVVSSCSAILHIQYKSD